MELKEKTINKKSIEVLPIPDNVIEILMRNKINTLGKLSNMTKTRLKEFGLEKEAIKQIEIELELIGLNLNVSL